MVDAMGLDFGTTNSALAVLKDEVVETVNVSNEDIGERTLRSVLFFEEDRTVSIGQSAVAHYMAQHGNYGRFLQSIKAFLSRSSFTHTNIFGRRYLIEDLVAIILRGLKKIGEERAGRTFNKVVLGRPVLFSEKPEDDSLAQKRLEEAAKRAGFADISFEYEPIAAAFSYYEQVEPGSDRDRIVLMGDFGGGTSDFNVMRLGSPIRSQEEKRQRILAVGGVYVGGDTFDARIMWEKVTPYFGKGVTYRGMTGQKLPMPVYLMQTICQWHLIPFLRDAATLRSIRAVKRTADDPSAVENLERLVIENKGFSIFQAIERSKKELSDRDTSSIVYRDSDVEISEPIGRDEFNYIIASDLETIRKCVLDTLNRAGVKAGEVGQVLLTGGSSFIPAVRDIFDNEFGSDKVLYLEAFTSVAQGLARTAALR